MLTINSSTRLFLGVYVEDFLNEGISSQSITRLEYTIVGSSTTAYSFIISTSELGIELEDSADGEELAVKL